MTCSNSDFKLVALESVLNHISMLKVSKKCGTATMKVQLRSTEPLFVRLLYFIRGRFVNFSTCRNTSLHT